MNQVDPLMVRPIGSPVTLTCTVDLSTAVDVPVTVNAQLSAPAGVTITSVTNSVMENTTRYTSTAMVESFGRIQSGEYTCTATIASSNSFLSSSSSRSGTLRVTTGEAIVHKIFDSPP